MSEEAKALVREFYEGDFIAGDASRLDRYFDPAFFDHDPPRPGLPRSPATVEAVMDMLRTAMPERSLRIEDILGEGDRVALRFRIDGVQAGPFAGMPPTNEPMTLKVIAILRIEGGRIAERWGLVERFVRR